MIVSILNLKGGAGKTTVSINLAVELAYYGYSVLIVDTDKQQNANDWYKAREQNEDLQENLAVEYPNYNLDLIAISSAEELKAKVFSLEEQYDIVIIDGCPQIGELSVISAVSSDLILLPLSPSYFDLQATNYIVRLVEEARTSNRALQAYFLLIRYKANTNLSRDMLSHLSEGDIPLLGTYLGDRVAYASSAHQGLSTVELNDPKAKEEVRSLAKKVLSIIAEEG